MKYLILGAAALLLADIAAGRVKALVIFHLDRVARRMEDLSRLLEVGRPIGLPIASVHGVSIDLSDPTGIAVAQILTAIAGMEVGHKAQRLDLPIQRQCQCQTNHRARGRRWQQPRRRPLRVTSPPRLSSNLRLSAKWSALPGAAAASTS